MATQDVIACDTCGLVQRLAPVAPGTAAECARCESVIVARGRGSLELTAALALAALILYVPANLYPILRMNLRGVYSESTVWDGVVSLAHANQWLVAAVVFLASMVIPVLKLAGLFFLVISSRLRLGRRLRGRTRIYKFIDRIGPWAMLDVFLLAVLVALVKLGTWATVLPGPGLIAFAAVVVLTMLASASFDPRLIWQRE
ncbi:MAG TPA: paraquat-inducible protein A [Burkholderiales bacterium]|nr:paraquat-inducible protein A [Burkholderiales bacterium]